MCSRLITFTCVALVLFGSGYSGDHSILKPRAALAQGVSVEEAIPEDQGLSSHPRLLLDTQVEVPAQNDNAVTLPEKKAGDSIQFQLFAPHAGGTQIQGFTVVEIFSGDFVFLCRVIWNGEVFSTQLDSEKITDQLRKSNAGISVVVGKQ